MVFPTKSSIAHWLVIAVIALCFLSAACSKKKTVIDSVALDAESLPTMHSEDVSWLISDSGITKHRLIAKVWDAYDNPHPDLSYSYFPEGFYVEQFDSVFNVEGSIKSDTAYYYDKKELWHLIGNVKIISLQGDKLETQELFWDAKRKKYPVYSDQPARVERADGEKIWGIGFESDLSMSDFHFFKVGAELYFSDNNDSIP